jgi:4-diphosphocytidyl-2-C-methyl-D-erythritol kinase
MSRSRHCIEKPMKSVEKAYAKINLTLDVIGKRADGYHELESVMQTLSLHDTLTLSGNHSGAITAKSSNPGLASDRRNLAVAAAHAFYSETGISCGGLHIHIDKRIPLCAGLGGGSADAAAVLRGLNAYYKTGLSLEALARIGLGVGSDVPYCVYGAAARVQGRGERVAILPKLPDCRVVVAKPRAWLSTAEVFARMEPGMYGGAERVGALIGAVHTGDLAGIAANLYNGMTAAAVSLCPAIGDCLAALKEAGALGAAMTGSGPSVFGLFQPGDEPLARLPDTKDWELYECRFINKEDATCHS